MGGYGPPTTTHSRALKMIGDRLAAQFGNEIDIKYVWNVMEFGYKAEEQPISVHDLHATILHLLGLDHTKLTYRSNGRDMRLTDVYGTLIPQIVA